jgi:hypothetical protein
MTLPRGAEFRFVVKAPYINAVTVAAPVPLDVFVELRQRARSHARSAFVRNL